MKHWLNTFPHKIYATTILKDNKIIYWKVGQNRLKDTYNIENLIKNHPSYSYEEHCFEVNTSTEHKNIFQIESVEWFRQFGLHEKFKGISPFDNNFKI
ncbi:hypothetical protein [Clostridium estertheticum]|uniref:hypothetical protein n=1 Tax=Clostridium estertheticum TaxID=238834 RepID=UPI001C7D0774|nr:hypothetical protein [Clostridium estertheticum]MBX4267171.1 hypothetical protein [Clostridium estertheticum]WLC91294.1 hypothetical protein KTC95_24120 [Clostridium estertheticum]